MLFTPHIFSFKGRSGLDFEISTNATSVEVFEMYADVLFAAALNAWVLDGKGTEDEFPYTRGDFHEYMVSEQRAFAQDVSFAVEALTGKTVKEIAHKDEGKNEEPGKKKASPLIGRLLKRSS